ncbi:hypothetical protein PAPYR_2640 [Paratrimastix pyriformis]|uniref:EGF-like domain-containing protein n=1 Tax=Paratrimastix pyriformis TaxID=342808 RepID=A0ABQ8USV8_9EUKA|nr:hypothetical protein PAPYR_2640 [Paratrimastix pyriformis]
MLHTETRAAVLLARTSAGAASATVTIPSNVDPGSWLVTLTDADTDAYMASFYLSVSPPPIAIMTPLYSGDTVAQRGRPLTVAWRQSGALAPSANQTQAQIEIMDRTMTRVMNTTWVWADRWASDPAVFEVNATVPVTLPVGVYRLRVYTNTTTSNATATSAEFTVCSLVLQALANSSYLGGSQVTVSWNTSCPMTTASLSVGGSGLAGGDEVMVEGIPVSRGAIDPYNFFGLPGGSFLFDFHPRCLMACLTCRDISQTSRNPGFRVVSSVSYTVVDESSGNLYASLPIVKRYRVLDPLGATRGCSLAETWLRDWSFTVAMAGSSVAFDFPADATGSTCDGDVFLLFFNTPLSEAIDIITLPSFPLPTPIQVRPAYHGISQNATQIFILSLAADLSLAASTIQLPERAPLGQPLVGALYAYTAAGNFMPCSPGSAFIKGTDGLLRPVLRQGLGRGSSSPIQGMTELANYCLGDYAFPLTFNPVGSTPGNQTLSVCFYLNGATMRYTCVDRNVSFESEISTGFRHFSHRNSQNVCFYLNGATMRYTCVDRNVSFESLWVSEVDRNLPELCDGWITEISGDLTNFNSDTIRSQTPPPSIIPWVFLIFNFNHPCTTARTCTQCALRPTCGWCGSTQRCLWMTSSDQLTSPPAACPVAALWHAVPSTCGDESNVCPAGCNGHGTCDTVTSVCTCDPGWSGVGCGVSQPAWKWVEDVQGSLSVDSPLILDERFSSGAPAGTLPRLVVLDINAGLTIYERSATGWSMHSQQPISDLDLRTDIVAFDGVSVLLYSAITDDITAYHINEATHTFTMQKLPANIVFTQGQYEDALVSHTAEIATGQVLLTSNTLVAMLGTGELITMARQDSGLFALVDSKWVSTHAAPLSLTSIMPQSLLLRNGTALLMYTRPDSASGWTLVAEPDLPYTTCQTTWYQSILAGTTARGYAPGFPRVPCAFYGPDIFVYFVAKSTTLAKVSVEFYRKGASGWARQPTTLLLNLVGTQLALFTSVADPARPFAMLGIEGGVLSSQSYPQPPASVGGYPLVEQNGYWASTWTDMTPERVATAEFLLARQAATPEYTLYRVSRLRVPGDCNGPTHGTCDTATGLCVCTSHFSGPNCSVPLCPDGCSGHGYCNPATALCECYPGYASANCGRASCPMTPLGECNGGSSICEPTARKCTCPLGFSGDDCSNHMDNVDWRVVESNVAVGPNFRPPFTFYGRSMLTLTPQGDSHRTALLTTYQQKLSTLSAVADLTYIIDPTALLAADETIDWGFSADVRTLFSLSGGVLVTADTLDTKFAVPIIFPGMWLLQQARHFHTTRTYAGDVRSRSLRSTEVDHNAQPAQIWERDPLMPTRFVLSGSRVTVCGNRPVAQLGIAGNFIFIMTLSSPDPVIYNRAASPPAFVASTCPKTGTATGSSSTQVWLALDEVGRGLEKLWVGRVVTDGANNAVIYHRSSNLPLITFYHTESGAAVQRYVESTFSLTAPPVGIVLDDEFGFVWSLRSFHAFRRDGWSWRPTNASGLGLASTGADLGVQSIVLDPEADRLVLTTATRVQVFMYHSDDEAWEKSDEVPVTRAQYALYYSSSELVALFVSVSNRINLYRPVPTYVSAALGPGETLENSTGQLISIPSTGYTQFDLLIGADDNVDSDETSVRFIASPTSLTPDVAIRMTVYPPGSSRHLDPVVSLAPYPCVMDLFRPILRAGTWQVRLEPNTVPDSGDSFPVRFVKGIHELGFEAEVVTSDVEPPAAYNGPLVLAHPPLRALRHVAPNGATAARVLSTEAYDWSSLVVPGDRNQSVVEFTVRTTQGKVRGGGYNPDEGGGGYNPDEGDGGYNPDGGGGGYNPDEGDGGYNPDEGDGGCNPDGGGGGYNPDEGDGGYNPDEGDGGCNPVEGGGGYNPDEGGGGYNPDEGGGGYNPDGGGGYNDGGYNPDEGGGGCNPDEGDGGYNPDGGGVDGTGVMLVESTRQDDPREVLVQRGSGKLTAENFTTIAATSAATIRTPPCNSTGRWWVGVRRSGGVASYTLTSTVTTGICPFDLVRNETLKVAATRPVHSPAFRNSADQGNDVMLARAAHRHIDFLFAESHDVEEGQANVKRQSCQGGVFLVLTMILMLALSAFVLMPRFYGTYYLTAEVRPGFDGNSSSAYPVRLLVHASFEGMMAPCADTQGSCDTNINVVLYRLVANPGGLTSLRCNTSYTADHIRMCDVTWACTNCSYTDQESDLRIEIRSGSGPNGAAYATRIHFDMTTWSDSYPADNHTFADVLEPEPGSVFMGGVGGVDSGAIDMLPSAVSVVVTPTIVAEFLPVTQETRVQSPALALYVFPSESVALPDDYRGNGNQIQVGVHHDLLSKAEGDSVSTLKELEARLLSPAAQMQDLLAGLLNTVISLAGMALGQYESLLPTIVKVLTCGKKKLKPRLPTLQERLVQISLDPECENVALMKALIAAANEPHPAGVTIDDAPTSTASAAAPLVTEKFPGGGLASKDLDEASMGLELVDTGTPPIGLLAASTPVQSPSPLRSPPFVEMHPFGVAQSVTPGAAVVLVTGPGDLSGGAERHL